MPVILEDGKSQIRYEDGQMISEALVYTSTLPPRAFDTRPFGPTPFDPKTDPRYVINVNVHIRPDGLLLVGKGKRVAKEEDLPRAAISNNQFGRREVDDGQYGRKILDKGIEMLVPSNNVLIRGKLYPLKTPQQNSK